MAEVLQAELPHLKLAHGYAREVFTIRVALALDDVAEDGHAVDVVVSAEKDAYEEELTDAVEYVEDFDEEVKHHKVVAQELAKHKAGENDETTKDVHVTVGGLTARIVHILVNGADHVLHHFSILFELVHALEVRRGLDHVLDVNARSQTKRAPN